MIYVEDSIVLLKTVICSDIAELYLIENFVILFYHDNLSA